jgi:hypothetical protein
MRIGGHWTKCVAAVVFGFMALGLAACDPRHPFEDVQVKIFSNGDGQATMSAEVHVDSAEGTTVDEAAFLDALASELGLGEVVGPAIVHPDRNSSGPAIQLSGVDQDLLTVSLASVLDVMDQFGLSGDATVFVSVCTPALNGTASGKGVDRAHRSSCATWEPTPRPATTDAVATLTFASRSAPSETSTLLALVLAVVGIAGAAAFVRASGVFRKVGLAGSIVAGIVSLVVAASAAISGIRLSDTWFDTGQTFDAALSSGYRKVIAVALIAGVAGPAVVMLAGTVVHRRSKATDR